MNEIIKRISSLKLGAQYILAVFILGSLIHQDFFYTCVQHPIYMLLLLSFMPTANLTVCLLVFNNPPTPDSFPHLHLLPLNFKLFLAQASGSQKVDKPASPSAGQHENLGTRTISGYQIN